MDIRIEVDGYKTLVSLGNRPQIIVPTIDISASGKTYEEAKENLEKTVNKHKETCCGANGECADSLIIIFRQIISGNSETCVVTQRVGIAVWGKRT